jgi:uncharacterized protein (TIGR03435 family)
MRPIPKTMKKLPVVVLKPCASNADERFPVSIHSGLSGKMTIRNAGVKDCITWACALPGSYVIDGNGQLFPDRYDIDAQSATAPTAEKDRKMLQALLADRFGLEVHRKDRGFRLQKSKGGKTKFQPGGG